MRTYNELTLEERVEIQQRLESGDGLRAIGRSLGRATSTIGREIGRNGGSETYRATQADHAAWDRARRPKTCKLMRHRTLARRVAGKLQRRWSPQQIAGWLKRRSPDEASDQMSHDRNSQIATLVERQTRDVMLVKIDGKDTQTVIDALIKHARSLPKELYRSLTWDRGKEMQSRMVCARGKVSVYKGMIQIKLTSPSQLVLQ